MREPKPAFPFDQFSNADSTLGSRDYLLTAIEHFKNAHVALLHNDKRAAVIEIDKTIAIAHAARNLLFAPAREAAPNPAPAVNQSELL